MTRTSLMTAVAAPVAALLLAAATPAPGVAAPLGTVAGAAATTTTVTSGPLAGFEGRGFGHGRGMSQWGARGMASQGSSVAAITAFYYPGTTTSSIGNPLVQVRLTAMGAGPTVVAGEAGLTLTGGGCTASLAPANATSWRVSRVSNAWQVEGYFTTSTGSTGWWPVPTTCASTFPAAPDLTFVGDGSLANSRLTVRTPSGNRDYSGGVRATPVTLRGTVTTRTYGTVNVLPMDTYLRSVVPAEMPASWQLEAVKAQAIAARSYAAARMGSADGFDVCDTTTCQVYPGLTTAYPETSNSNAAVAQTSGQVLHYGGKVALTEFGSTNGGQTVATSLPYQVAKADPYDGVYSAAPTTWTTANTTHTTLEQKWPTIGSFRSLSITRDGKGEWFGGRALTVVLTGTAGTTTVTAETFRATLGLRSTWFSPISVAPPLTHTLTTASVAGSTITPKAVMTRRGPSRSMLTHRTP